MNLTTQSDYAMVAVAGCCGATAITLSVHLMCAHLYYWREPRAQLPIVRILMLVPVYVLLGCATILFPDYALFLVLLRESYESFALYEFFRLVIHYFLVEAPRCRALVDQAAEDASRPRYDDDEEVVDDGADDAETSQFVRYLACYAPVPWPFPFCCLPVALTPGRRFYRLIRVCLFQYLFLRPILSFLAVLLSLRGSYDAERFSPSGPHLWIVLLSNVSIVVAFYALVVFLQLLDRVTGPVHRIFCKFASIKLLVFFVFWQSLLIAVLYWLDLLPPLGTGWSISRSALTLENLILCCELPLLSFWHLWIYSVAPYRLLMEAETTTLAPEERR